MAKIHTVRQGENLASIARTYRISNWRHIYEHPSNAEFAKQRPNPNIINPGDEIYIPDIKPQSTTIATGKLTRFVVKRENQTFTLKLLDHDRKPLRDTKVRVSLPRLQEPLHTNHEGILEIEMEAGDPLQFGIDIYAREDSPEPSHHYDVQLSALNSPECIAGLQARLNALGFPAGPVDGLMGRKTRSGIKSFQRTRADLVVDGKHGPKTYAALREEYGS